jgi:hypothetical protein
VRPLGDDGGESPLHIVDDAVLREDTLRIAAGEIDAWTCRDSSGLPLSARRNSSAVRRVSISPMRAKRSRGGHGAGWRYCEYPFSPNPQGRTWMTVFPARRSVALKVATASSRAEILPMFVRNRPSRTRWTISLS